MTNTKKNFYGLSVTYHDINETKNTERFLLEESCIEKPYSEKVVEVILKKVKTFLWEVVSSSSW